MTPAQLENPVFVVGYMHSGTTLLMNILSRNSTLFSARGETKYFDYLPMIRSKYPALHNDSVRREFIQFAAAIVLYGYQLRYKSWIKADAYLKDSPGLSNEALDILTAGAKHRPEHGFIFRLVSDYLAQCAGKSRWLEKTPTHIYHVDAIVQSIPDVLFVEITRDPRDVLASKKTRKLTVWSTERYQPEIRPIKHIEKSYDPLWDTLAWKSAIHAGIAARKKNRDSWLTIRYEDLIQAPESLVRDMCRFLKISFELEMLNVSAGNAAEWHEGHQRAGIRSDSVNRWHHVLTESEVALCQLLVKREMEHLNYESESISLANHFISIPFLLTKSTWEFWQRLANRWRLGGFRYFWTVLINYRKRLMKLARK